MARFSRKWERAYEGFTLIELLIVIGIVVILSTAVVLALNPAELLRQARDSTRFQEIAVLNKGFSLFEFEGAPGGYGNPSSTYFSVHDAAATTTVATYCTGMGINGPPVGRLYRCAASSTVNLVNGNGWMPVNFGAISAGAPFSRLPRDPTNTVASENYFTYVASSGSAWAFTIPLESIKYLVTAKQDDGYNPAKYEIGKDISLVAVSEGLVGWWPFDEGIGLIANDKSKNGNNSALANGPTWVAGKLNRAVNFDGLDDNVNAGSQSSLDNISKLSTCAWIYPRSIGQVNGSNQYGEIVTKGDGTGGWFLELSNQDSGFASVYFYRTFLGSDGYWHGSNNAVQLNVWSYVCLTYDNTSAANNPSLYVNGSPLTVTQYYTPSGSANSDATGNLYIGNYDSINQTFDGWIDDVRVYNRILSALEVQKLYNATK